MRRAGCWLPVLLSAASLPAMAADPGRRVETAGCLPLARHVPAPDVAFQPGRDVRGRPVPKADLEGGAGIELPASFDFTLTVSPLSHRLNRRLEAYDAAIAAAPPGSPERWKLVERRDALAREADRVAAGFGGTALPLGVVGIHGDDGAVTYDGRPLEAPIPPCR